MHPALLIPEIVSRIIECNISEPGYLYTCLLLNRIFFYSAARILWRGCGIEALAEEDNSTPHIRYLLKIARRDSRRGQIYANFVKVIRAEQIDRLDRVYGDEGQLFVFNRLRAFRNERQSFSEIAGIGLEWPNLEVLAVRLRLWHKPHAEMLKTFLQPKLKSLTIHQSGQISDGLLELLEKRCPGLNHLALKPILVRDGISKCNLGRVMGTLKLESLDIRAEGFEHGYLEEELLEVLCRQGRLRRISIPDISDSTLRWITKMQKGDSALFPALRSICTGVSSSSLEYLHHTHPHLTTLDLDLRRFPLSVSTSIFPKVSLFSQLSEFSIQLDRRMQIYGNDLIHLVRSCSYLSRLSVAKEQHHQERPWSSDIKDYHIGEIARNSTNLKELYLLFIIPENWGIPDLREYWPTDVGLEALARHCVNLERVWLTCDPSWHCLTTEPLEILFPNVHDLRISGPFARTELECDTEEDLRDAAIALVARCPKLAEFKFLDMYGEEPFDVMVKDVLCANR